MTNDKRTETHACDLISRQAAIDALDKRFDSIPMEQTTEILQLRRDLRHLPSAQPDVPDTNVGDMISRQAAIDALDFEIVHMTAYCDGKNEGNPLAQYNKGLEDGKKAIEALPSAQPEIIRCKDCKYNPNPPEFGNAACVLFYGMTDQMGFCHHGERRERA